MLEQIKKSMELRWNKNAAKQGEYHVMICGGTGCTSTGSNGLMEEFNREIEKKGLTDKIKVVRTGCFGLCELGPIAIVYPEGTFYANMTKDCVKEIIEKHLIGGEPVKELVYGEGQEFKETPFYKPQKRIALRHCGLIDPENIDEYLALDGYRALEKCLNKYSPEQVIEIIKKSGLRGRGGAGFPTGTKWQFAAASDADQKYVACNADEGDPGAFMDRSVLEGDPHSIIEAMAIAGYAIGGTQGYIYIRAEYPIAVKRLTIAINQARERGLLGKNIFGKKFTFDVEIRLGAGAFVCGEETALIASIEGERGEPRPRPPFPAVEGIFGKPTLLNNVETYANVTQIILNGSEWYANMGTEGSKGTKVFALGGKITNTGLVEVPMGTTLREIVEGIGGGCPNEKKFKAAQTGGPSGGCIPASLMDTPIDYDNLAAVGSMMGSGGLIVMDEDNCMVDIARFYLEFTVDESCGKCPPCRIGTKRMLEILTRITQGKGEEGDIEKLVEIGEETKSTALCALGQTAPNPVLSTIKHFRSEYEAHIKEKRCPAKQCSALLQYKIIPYQCKGCGMCAKACPVDCITGKIKYPFEINTKKCIKCGTCVKTCKFDAILRV